MKKTLLIIAVAGLAMASCKKDRTCTCTDSSTEPGYVGSTQKKTLVKVTKRQANANCVSVKYDDSVGGSTYTYTDDCKLN